ncbi:MAG: DUF2062 domain-containing protein [Syntrophobacterales bacterium]|nr:DUF2062 domain-containing protein [Syntrophobacterales bacterium]HNQ02273.1 DUF2062 domain-containing protein [Syntrophales bacterium]HNS53667.1 DUF2062 domain-containing protein [Syntrophales bacterium]
MAIQDRIREFHNRFLSLGGAPEEIARAMALGVFIGVTPTIPFHTALIMVSCLALRQNITAAILGATIISNPLTIPLLYLAEYELGVLVLGVPANPFSVPNYDILAILEIGLHILYPLLAGGLLLAAAVALPSYFLTRQAVVRMRARHAEPAEPSP